VKTGFTTQARHTMIGAATRGGRMLIVALMKVPHPYVSREAAALLDWGFAHGGTAVPVGELVAPDAFDEPADWIPGGVAAAPMPGQGTTSGLPTRRPGGVALAAAVAGTLVAAGALAHALRRRRVRFRG
jgi:D-alanyl-D-alanine carboxypeptidase (penicillin-binding protein 5/6)